MKKSLAQTVRLQGFSRYLYMREDGNDKNDRSIVKNLSNRIKCINRRVYRYNKYRIGIYPLGVLYRRAHTRWKQSKKAHRLNAPVEIRGSGLDGDRLIDSEPRFPLYRAVARAHISLPYPSHLSSCNHLSTHIPTYIYTYTRIHIYTYTHITYTHTHTKIGLVIKSRDF